jgi:hypothetical protein
MDLSNAHNNSALIIKPIRNLPLFVKIIIASDEVTSVHAMSVSGINFADKLQSIS